MQKLIFQTIYNHRDVVSRGEVYTLPSMTQPDQAMSIADLMRNHVRDLPTLGGKIKEPVYLGEEHYYPPLETLDLIDRQDMLDEAKSQINAARELHQQKLAQKRANKQKQNNNPPNLNKDEGQPPASDAQPGAPSGA